MADEYYTKSLASLKLGVSVTTINRMLDDGRLSFCTISGARYPLKSDVDSLAKARHKKRVRKVIRREQGEGP